MQHHVGIGEGCLLVIGRQQFGDGHIVQVGVEGRLGIDGQLVGKTDVDGTGRSGILQHVFLYQSHSFSCSIQQRATHVVVLVRSRCLVVIVAVVFIGGGDADYRVKNVSDQKIKKNDAELTLVLEKNPDILKELGEMKQPHQTLVGFAAETQNLLQYAKGKLEKKNLDMIVANDVSKPQAGFNVDTNLIKLLKRDGSIEELPLMSKKELAYIILDRVMKLRK